MTSNGGMAIMGEHTGEPADIAEGDSMDVLGDINEGDVTAELDVANNETELSVSASSSPL